jgi:hypothetical protein
MASSPETGSTKLGDDKHPVVVDAKDIAILESPSASEDSGSEEEFGDLAKNPFLDPAVAAHWRQVYEDAQYECRHAFDATLTWTEEEEKRVIRKLDWRICTWAVCVQIRLVMSWADDHSVSCSLLSRSTEAISNRRWLITCWTTWGLTQTVITPAHLTYGTTHG